MTFELTNEQRQYFGLDPIKSNWDKVVLKGDQYRPDSFLYFEGDTIKRHIISTDNKYSEKQYNDLTRNRTILLPKTDKGKEKKLSGSVLESRQATGVYLNVDNYGNIFIGNFTTQNTFYSSWWEQKNWTDTIDCKAAIEDFIKKTPKDHFTKIDDFKNSKRKNVKFKPGDFFVAKMNLTEYGFGRVLLNVYDLNKKNLLSEHHGLKLLMGHAVLVKFYSYSSEKKDIDLDFLQSQPCLPSGYMMDNQLLYGDYEIIGHCELQEEGFEFPMSYGSSINLSHPCVFLQWGLIHIETSSNKFNKYLNEENPLLPENSRSGINHNPYGYYSIGFSPDYDTFDIKASIKNNGQYDFSVPDFKSIFDLRNPRNKDKRVEIMNAFGLDPNKNYIENCILTKTPKTTEILKLLSKK